MTTQTTTPQAAMPAAQWVDTDTITVAEVPTPQIPDGWALVEVAYNGICGTDLAILHGKHPRAQHGLIPGHELSGRVVVAGDGGPGVGALVAAEPLITCGKCRACRTGSSHVCRNLGLYGIDTPGALARYVALPPQVLHEVPGDVDPKLAALVEPLAVPCTRWSSPACRRVTRSPSRAPGRSGC